MNSGNRLSPGEECIRVCVDVSRVLLSLVPVDVSAFPEQGEELMAAGSSCVPCTQLSLCRLGDFLLSAERVL